MTYSEPTQMKIYRTRIRWIRVVGLLAAIGVIAAVLGQLPASMSSTRLTPSDVLRSDHGGVDREGLRPPGEQAGVPAENGDVLSEADGAIPDGTTVFAGDVPGVAKLDPDLLAALREAATDAAGDGVEFVVDSGWRSRAYQQRLLQEAVAKYGSEEEAARWVATPGTSPHVSGNAIDVGSDAAGWLSEHGAGYGLCQIYANEPWHYELRPEATDQGCPAMYDDPTHDPRMEQ